MGYVRRMLPLCSLGLYTLEALEFRAYDFLLRSDLEIRSRPFAADVGLTDSSSVGYGPCHAGDSYIIWRYDGSHKKSEFLIARRRVHNLTMFAH